MIAKVDTPEYRAEVARLEALPPGACLVYNDEKCDEHLCSVLWQLSRGASRYNMSLMSCGLKRQRSPAT